LTCQTIKNSITSLKNYVRITAHAQFSYGGTKLRRVRFIRLAVRFRITLLLITLLFSTGVATGERLPVKTYTTEDGLLRNLVRQILPDSNGYLWLVTPSGLSRFDGYEFKNFAAGQSALISLFWRMIEDRRGGYWLATMGAGLYRFHPDLSTIDEASRFKLYTLGSDPRTAQISALYQDHTGKVWSGTNSGLFCLDEANGESEFRQVELGLKDDEALSLAIAHLAEDDEGSLWIATNVGLFRRLPEGRMIRYQLPATEAADVGHIFVDRDGRLWIEHTKGPIVLLPEPAARINGNVMLRLQPKNNEGVRRSDVALRLPTHPGEAVRLDEADGFIGRDITDVCQTSDGKLWIGIYDKGLLSFDGKQFRLYGKEAGLSHYKVRSLAVDREDNLWIGTDGGGLMKKVRGGITGFSAADGIDETIISFLAEDAELGICVATDTRQIGRFDGEKFIAMRGAKLDNLLDSLLRERTLFYYSSPVLKDHLGEYWFATSDGIYRYPRLQRLDQLTTAKPTAIYTTKNGLPSNNIYRVLEDSKGDIWVSFLSIWNGLLCKWERATDSFRIYGKEEGLTASSPISSICEDRQGNIWFGFGNLTYKGGQIARFDGKRFQLFSKEEGVPEGSIRELFVDTQGRLWIASSRGGLGRIDHPGASKLDCSTYTIADGLADNEINCVAEDRWGHIYVGMGRGLDRIDPQNNRIRHFKGSDGLTSDDVRKIFRDSQNRFWIGTSKGLFHFTPEAELPKPAPPIFITRLIIAGEEKPISQAGETQINRLELESNRNNLQIDFVSPSVSYATTIRYRYKLEGANREWSPLTDLRTIQFANLSPGSYRFLVQAINGEGAASETPASLRFTILPPIWRRWWFLALCSVLCFSFALTIQRFRNTRQRERLQAEAALRQARDERLIELELVRRRIATDLHDDVGSSLTQISLLSEVAQQRLNGQEAALSEPLSLIARLSGELVDAMSDIVWAINPKKDHLSDLSQRMRHFASDVLTMRQIELQFQSPYEEQDVKVGANVRREVFLIFKESINNLVRHSGCSKANVEFRVEDERMVLILSDNGKGFDVTQKSNGHGLTSLKERCKSLGGELTIDSHTGRGTTVSLVVPLKQQEPSLSDLQRP
jgi:ligand-binding sensor domain-containing protein/signal transduction histidine kinase